MMHDLQLEKNICVKAYNLLKDDFNLGNVKIHLHKRIKIGAGLGGGSSDGAFTLMMLNELFDLKLSTSILKSYALMLGSDCPFFIENTPQYVSGIGEKMDKTDIVKILEIRSMLINEYKQIPGKDEPSSLVRAKDIAITLDKAIRKIDLLLEGKVNFASKQ